MALPIEVVRGLLALARTQVSEADFDAAALTLEQALAAQRDYIQTLMDQKDALLARIDGQRGLVSIIQKAKAAVEVIAELV
jgi:Tfp pilus assembly protein PilN